MKTLANCTPREFAVQTAKIAARVRKYTDGIKKIKEKFSAEEKHEDIFEIINYICDGNIDETMALCGEMCFKTGEEFGGLDPEQGDEDGIAALVEMLNSPRCVRFFTTVLGLKNLIDRL